MRRKFFRLVLVLVTAALATWIWLSQQNEAGHSRLEQIVVNQLELLAAKNLHPTLRIGSVSYEFPYTFKLSNVRLVAADPAAKEPGGTVDVFSANQLVLILARVPRMGQPIQVRSLTFDKPTVNLVSVSETDGTLIGFSNLIKSSAGDPVQLPGEEDAPPSPPTKLSDFFQIDSINIRGLTLKYDARTPTQPAMALRDIHSEFTVDYEQSDWHSVQLAFRQKALFSLDLVGKFNLNSLEIDLDQVKLMTQLDAESMAHLPPVIQTIVRDHDLSGAFQFDGEMQYAIGVAETFLVAGDMEMTDVNIATSGFHLPIKRLTGDLAISAKELALTDAKSDLWGGSMTGRFSMQLTDKLDAALDIDLVAARVQQVITAFRATPDTQPSASTPPDTTRDTYEGELSGHVTLLLPLADEPLSHLGGAGTLSVKRARFSKHPIGAQMLKALNLATQPFRGSGANRGGQDVAEAQFRIEPNQIYFSKWRSVSSTMAARGSGTVGLDGTINFSVNAGPLEKAQAIAEEGVLDPIAKLFANITDRLAHYRITGTLDNPVVKLAPGGRK